MSDSGTSNLRSLLLQRYDELKTRLTWRLGSADLAGDALHDAWVRLEERTEKIEPVQHPLAYLTRMVTNIALDYLHSDRRNISGAEVDELVAQIIDTAPGPLEIAEDRAEVEALTRLIDSLPPRRRAILLAVRIEGLSNQGAADRFGISTRLVGLELKRAHEYCVARMPR